VARPRLTRLASSVRVLADEFWLRERGIGQDELTEGTSPASTDTLVDLIV
jgi:hypothetical protein